MAIFIFVAQVLGFSITLFAADVLAIFDLFTPSPAEWNDFAEVRAQHLVIESLTRTHDGSFRLEPTPALTAYVARVPTLRYAVLDPRTKAGLPGSSPELATILSSKDNIVTEGLRFRMTGQIDHRLRGVLRELKTPHGRMPVAVHGYMFHWDDLIDYSIERMNENLGFYVPEFLVAAAIGWLVLKRGLEPLNKASREAERIDMDSLDQRLSMADIPYEIEPLVTSINNALERLDEGAVRQRRFIANAAHEMRTPVAILIARLDHPEEKSFLNDLKRDARRVRNIVEQLLATARLDKRGAAPEALVDFAQVVRSVVDDHALLALKQGRRLELELLDETTLVKGDRLALESIVANLIDNALRAEPPGGAVVVRVGPDGEAAVIDHGEGVAVGDRRMIFEPFWRKNETTSGTGLGLAITKELVRKYKGHIWVEETPGGGATFKLSFSVNRSR